MTREVRRIARPILNTEYEVRLRCGRYLSAVVEGLRDSSSIPLAVNSTRGGDSGHACGGFVVGRRLQLGQQHGQPALQRIEMLVADQFGPLGLDATSGGHRQRADPRTARSQEHQPYAPVG